VPGASPSNVGAHGGSLLSLVVSRLCRGAAERGRAPVGSPSRCAGLRTHRLGPRAPSAWREACAVPLEPRIRGRSAARRPGRGACSGSKRRPARCAVRTRHRSTCTQAKTAARIGESTRRGLVAGRCVLPSREARASSESANVTRALRGTSRAGHGSLHRGPSLRAREPV